MNETSVKLEGGMRDYHSDTSPSLFIVVMDSLSGARICELEIPGSTILALLSNSFSERNVASFKFYGMDHVGKHHQVIHLQVPIEPTFQGYTDDTLAVAFASVEQVLGLKGFTIRSATTGDGTDIKHAMLRESLSTMCRPTGTSNQAIP
jgi:hypothetical protein